MALSPGRPRKHRALDEVEDLPIINEFSQDALDSLDEPPDIENFLTELGIKGKQYSCQIKQFPAEGGGIPAFLPSNYKGRYPTIDELGTKYGPGKYLYVFTWTVPRPDGGHKQTMKELEVLLSEAWDDAHEEYLYQYSLKRRKRLRQVKNKAELDGILYDHEKPSGTPGNGMDDLINAKNKLMQLGVPVGQSGGGTDLMAGGTGGIFALMMTMQQKSTELMVQMMTGSQQQMMALVTAVLANNSNKGNPYGDMFKEVAGMFTQMVDLKQALNPEKQTMVDKIFGLLETVSPQVLGMLKMSAAQRRQDPFYKLAASSQELKNLKGDQEATDALAARLDAHYGVQNTNDIMTVMGLSRSESMKAKLRGMGYPTEPRQAPAAAQEVPADVIPDAQPERPPEAPEAHPEEGFEVPDSEFDDIEGVE